MKKAKKITFVMILVVLALCVVGTTLAWLTAQSEEVENTFTVGNIKINLDEAELTVKDAFKMVPGWTISKTPIVTVEGGSEDCFVFIEITEENDLDSYIDYAVKETESEGKEYKWTKLAKDADGNDVNGVYYMVVDSKNTDQTFEILAGAEGKTYPNDYNIDLGTYKWEDNEVLVKPTVTESMMETAKTNAPKLKFQAYAVQEMKNNNTPFTAAEAWAIAKPATQTQPEEGAEG